MKKILVFLIMAVMLCSCGYEKLDRSEKFKLLYEAEVLHKKSAREKIKKIYEKLDKYTAKNNEKAIKEKEEYNNITSYFRNSSLNYKGFSWLTYVSNENMAYPPIKEIIAKEGEPASVQFRMYEEDGEFYDYLTDEPYTGIGISRYATGDISEVFFIENGKKKNIIQKNEINNNNKISKENFYEDGKLIAYKKYTIYGGLKEEVYILERYSNGNIKKDYIKSKGTKTGKLREYNLKKMIIKEIEK